MGLFLLRFKRNVYLSALIFQNLPCPEKTLVACLLVEFLTQKGAIARIKKANAILKCPVNKPFRIEYTYHDTNQKDKAKEPKLR